MAYPTFSASQAAQLADVEHSVDGAMRYAPCRVALRSGEVVDRVYVVEARMHLAHWGVDPKDDPGKQWLSIEDAVLIESSPTRLPVAFANELYRAGESGMGYAVFTVIGRDGSRLPYLTGNAVDFPMWPVGFDPHDIVGVLPHAGRVRTRRRMPAPDQTTAPYHWCLYSA